MSGGKISGNKAGSGGGVYIQYNGTFTMLGGEISGNTAFDTTSYDADSYGGGGVYVRHYIYGGVEDGIFRIVSGTVYGSEADTDLRNTALNGATLAGNGTAQRGVLSGSTFLPYGNLATTDTTIKVLNGYVK